MWIKSSIYRITKPSPSRTGKTQVGRAKRQAQRVVLIITPLSPARGPSFGLRQLNSMQHHGSPQRPVVMITVRCGLSSCLTSTPFFSAKYLCFCFFTTAKHYGPFWWQRSIVVIVSFNFKTLILCRIFTFWISTTARHYVPFWWQRSVVATVSFAFETSKLSAKFHLLDLHNGTSLRPVLLTTVRIDGRFHLPWMLTFLCRILPSGPP